MRDPIRTPKLVTLLTLTFALAAATLSGCLGGASANSGLYVKDALTDDASAVYVTFTLAQVKPVGGAWETVFEGKETIELLSLSAADAKERLAVFELAPGSYEGLRIAVSEVEITRLDGSTQLLNVYGNIVGIAENFTVGADGIDVLVDFDLEAGVDLAAGTYTPVVADVQTSDDDADKDGDSDFKDSDDDQDGIKDDDDQDDDGDGEEDEPEQQYGANTEELCAAEQKDELAEAQAERNETLAEAASQRDASLAQANLSAEDRAEANAEYNATVAEASAEYDAEVAEVADEKTECLSEKSEDESEGSETDDAVEAEDGEPNGTTETGDAS